MLIRYDQESQAAYIKLLDSKVIESEEIAPGIVYDFDVKDKIRGIEFYRLDSLSREEFINLNLPLQLRDKEIIETCLFSLSKLTPKFTIFFGKESPN
ncbi:UNVERIFIED_CONTAM: hypothetical protein BEN50_00140, partial [Euhalothece sp. KZN 001]